MSSNLPTFRTSVLAGLSSADAVVGALDLAPMQVTVVLRKWSGGEPGKGYGAEKLLPLPSWTVLKLISEREITGSGGRYRAGDLRVGPVRPYWVDCTGTPGGFLMSELDPTVQDDAFEKFFRLTKTNPGGTGEAGDYNLIDLDTEDALAYTLTIRRRTQPSSEPVAGEDGWRPTGRL